MPRSIRPSAASGRERGGRPGSVDHRSTSSGHESRVPWRGGASWADRSVSSRLRAILSIRPRGPPSAVGCFRLMKARERAVRTKAPGASTSGRVYGPLRASVKQRAHGDELRSGQMVRVSPGSPHKDTPRQYPDSRAPVPCEPTLAGAILPEPPTPGRSRAPSDPSGGAGGAVNPAPLSGVRGPDTCFAVARSSLGRSVGDSFL